MADLSSTTPSLRMFFLALWTSCIVASTWARAPNQNNQDFLPLPQQQQQQQDPALVSGGLKFNPLPVNTNNLDGNRLQDGPLLPLQFRQSHKKQNKSLTVLGSGVSGLIPWMHLLEAQHKADGQKFERVGNKIYTHEQLQNLQQNLHILPDKDRSANINNINNDNYAKQADLNNNNQLNSVVNMAADKKDVVVKVSKDKVVKQVINHVNVAENNIKENLDKSINSNAFDTDVAQEKSRKSKVTKVVSDDGALDLNVNEKPRVEQTKVITGDMFDQKRNAIPNVGVIEDTKNNNVIENFNNNRNDNNVYSDNGNSAVPNNGAGKDTGVINAAAIDTNEIPQRVVPVVDNQGNDGKANIQHDPPVEEKPGSLKVVWDWTDFAVNFEQYVMPEQKIRRAPHATTGEPWPMPQYYVSKKDKVYRIDKTNFRFDLSKIKCDIIEKAVDRYRPYILEDPVEDMYDNFQHAQSTMFEEPSTKYDTPLFLEASLVSRVLIKIRKPCSKYPTAKSDETYDLFVKRTGIHIWANEVWGALRGLETLSQIVFKGSNQLLYIRDTVINDYPRFSHRGLLLDSSRHFIFKETIYDALEGMAQNKMNVLHWHIVDDQSFPFYSNAYPDLSTKGAYHPTFVYMPEDIADIIEFARLRGIRVEPEFDTPGHTYSWGLSRPDILTQCYQGDRPVDGYLGPMDPSKNETFRFLKNFFKDVLHQFKDQYIHLGGDEVPMTCWQSNMEVTKFLAKLEGKPENEVRNTDPYYYSYDIRKVLEYYVTRLIKDIKSLGTKRSTGVRMVFWQEIMNNNVQLPNDTIIQVWQGGMEEVERAISLGMNVIFSTCWYLDLIEYGTKWSKYYQCDPADTTYGFSIDESKVLGGEACLWAEYIDNENLMTTLWPRASATAERLWSNKDVRDLDSAAARLQEHRCRMLSRGLGVGQISGPDYCLRRGKRRQSMNETSSNCTMSQCAQYNEKSRVEVENIKVEFEQKGGHISDCSQAVLQAGGQLTLVTLLLILVAVAVTLTFTKKKIAQVRMCKNKTILMVFVTLILVYFMCYTSIWMQALEFKGSFEKRVSSNVQT